MYLELVKLRNEFARSLGYENYAAYAYPNLYGRDYTPEQALAFCRAAMEQMTPLVASWREAGHDPALDLAAVDGLLYGRTEQELVDGDSASCAEVVWDVLELMGVKADRALAEAVYVGVSTDTGCFRFSNTTAHTFSVAALCTRAGARI